MNIVKNCIENCNAKSISHFDEAIIPPAVLIAKYLPNCRNMSKSFFLNLQIQKSIVFATIIRRKYGSWN